MIAIVYLLIIAAPFLFPKVFFRDSSDTARVVTSSSVYSFPNALSDSEDSEAEEPTSTPTVPDSASEDDTNAETFQFIARPTIETHNPFETLSYHD